MQVPQVKEPQQGILKEKDSGHSRGLWERLLLKQWGKHFSDEEEENSMTYDSESGGSEKSSNNATNTEEEAWNNGFRYLIIIDKLTHITSNIKEHKLISNNLYTAFHIRSTDRKSVV